MLVSGGLLRDDPLELSLRRRLRLKLGRLDPRPGPKVAPRRPTPIHHSGAPIHPNLGRLQHPRIRRYGIYLANAEASHTGTATERPTELLAALLDTLARSPLALLVNMVAVSRTGMATSISLFAFARMWLLSARMSGGPELATMRSTSRSESSRRRSARR
jgi:hypothetical protein